MAEFAFLVWWFSGLFAVAINTMVLCGELVGIVKADVNEPNINAQAVAS